MNTIRRADTRDIPDIMRLLLQVGMVHHAIRPDLFRANATKYTEDELAAILADDDKPVFACVDGNDRLLGYAFCVIQDHTDANVLTDIRTLYIDDLCVDEAARGRRIGKALYEYVVSWARENGFYNVTLNVWEGNDAAKRFYEAMGMKPQKTGMETIL